MFMEHWADCVLWIIPFDPLNHLVRQTPLYFSFFIRGNWGFVKLYNVPKVHSAVPLPSTSPRENHSRWLAGGPTHQIPSFTWFTAAFPVPGDRHEPVVPEVPGHRSVHSATDTGGQEGRGHSDMHDHESHVAKVECLDGDIGNQSRKTRQRLTH